MKISFKRSSSGRKARAPRWWGVFTNYLPELSVPFLCPKIWNKELANKWVNAVPDKCPFERQIWIDDTLLLYIPPLCPLNPLSKQLYEIKLEAKTFLYSLEKKQIKDS